MNWLDVGLGIVAAVLIYYWWRKLERLCDDIKAIRARLTPPPEETP